MPASRQLERCSSIPLLIVVDGWVHKRGITLIGAHNSVRPRSDAVPAFWPLRDDVDLVLRLMAAEKLAVDPLMTTRLPGNEAPEAYRLVTQKKLDALGILLDWREEF